MAKYGTFKYKIAKYGSYAVLRTSIILKDNFKINTLHNKVVQIEGRHRFRIKTNDGAYLTTNTVEISGEFSKLRIRTNLDKKYIICERKILD